MTSAKKVGAPKTKTKFQKKKLNLDKLLWGVGKRLHNVIKIPILNIWFCIAIFGILFAILGNQINQIVINYFVFSFFFGGGVGRSKA